MKEEQKKWINDQMFVISKLKNGDEDDESERILNQIRARKMEKSKKYVTQQNNETKYSTSTLSIIDQKFKKMDELIERLMKVNQDISQRLDSLERAQEPRIIPQTKKYYPKEHLNEDAYEKAMRLIR